VNVVPVKAPAHILQPPQEIRQAIVTDYQFIER